jgi:hypothetical protein
VALTPLAAGEVPAAAGALAAFPGVAGASFRAGALDDGASVPGLAAAGWAVVAVVVADAVRWAGDTVPAERTGGLGHRSRTGVPQAVQSSLQVPADCEGR